MISPATSLPAEPSASLQTEGLFTSPSSGVEIRAIPLPAPGPDEVRIRTAWSYISAGTELNAVNGCLAGKADFAAPRRLGYSLAGVVEEVGSRVEGIAVGSRVAAIGEGAYHGREAIVAKNLVCPVPDGVPLREACCMAMFCFALEGFRKAAIEFGENVVVLGGGLMGQLVGRFCVGAGATTFLVDGNAHRLAFAHPLLRPLAAGEGCWEEVAAGTAPHRLDAAFVCFGGDATQPVRAAIAAMQTGPDNVAQGRIVFCGGAEVTLRMASASGNVRFLSSAKAGPGYRDAAFEHGADYTRGYVKWTVRRNMEALLAALERSILTAADLITHEFPFEEAERAYQLLRQSNPEAMAVVLKYE
ncbi:MAG TPA: zinc-binding alcohol dehydrogenase [Chthoniobacteraceae bacterium]|nr:zinc-binding alcohol dehydrogenase [Chthoniobacteraceae bacterium]